MQGRIGASTNPETFAPVAQLVERCAENAEVIGSIPIGRTAVFLPKGFSALLLRWQ